MAGTQSFTRREFTRASVRDKAGAAGVGAGTDATAVFAEADVDPTTITTSTFQIFKGTSSTAFSATPVGNASVSYDAVAKAATLDPFGSTANNLAKATWYKVVLEGGPGGVEDNAGNPLASDRVWTFKTRN